MLSMLSYLKDLLSLVQPGSQPPPTGGLQVTPQLLLMLDEISRAMSSTMEGIQPTLDLICEAVTLIVRVEKCVILSLDETARRLEVSAGRGMLDSSRILGITIPQDVGAIGLCIREKRPIIGDLALELDRPLREVYQRLELQRFVAMPLLFSDRTLGVLIADTRLDHVPFTADDLMLIRMLANLAAVSRENASLITDLRQRNQRLSAMLEIGSALSSTLDLKTLLDLILEHSISLTRASTGALLLTDDSGERLILQSSRGIDLEQFDHLTLGPGQGITGWVLLEKASILVPDVNRDPRYLAVNPQVRSELAVPIHHKGRVVGVINVDSFAPAAFSSRDQVLLEVIAAQAAVAIRNASLFTELKTQILAE
jgi:sigma-B regulation protein RsbU (phosphoserine phosphatase)